MRGGPTLSPRTNEMKVLVPEIAAHANIEQNKNQEILSVDFHPKLPLFASVGAGENQIIFWKLTADSNNDEAEGIDWVEFLFEITEARTVNICRFSPCGQYLACGDAGGQIFLLACKEGAWPQIRDAKEVRKQNFRGGHTLDVIDLAWSSDRYLASAAMDNLVVIWDHETGTELHRFRDHTHYCQGVAWNRDTLASASVDETSLVCRITSNAKRAPPTVGEVQVLGGKRTTRLFANEVQGGTFCRRLSFSPCGGELLIVPGGIYGETHAPAAHIFRFRENGKLEATTPCATLQGFTSPTLAVRFHPAQFLSRVQEGEGMAGAARFVFAVATIDSVLVYDTEQNFPLAVCEKLHYASITDLTWRVNAKTGVSFLIASSRDGCFSIARFEQNELGEMAAAAMQEEEMNENSTSSTSSTKRQRRVALETLSSSPAKPAAAQPEQTVNVMQPRRVQLVQQPKE